MFNRVAPRVAPRSHHLNQSHRWWAACRVMPSREPISAQEYPQPRRSLTTSAMAASSSAGLHFHDLRHIGNQFAANSGAALKDLMARMGHDTERAALIYQHEARGADKRITDAIDTHVQAEQPNDDDDGTAGGLLPVG